MKKGDLSPISNKLYPHTNYLNANNYKLKTTNYKLVLPSFNFQSLLRCLTLGFLFGKTIASGN